MAAKEPSQRISDAATVDEYLARLDRPERTVLAKLREQIRQAAPEAEEVISYQIPTYRLHGPLVHFAAQPKHLSLLYRSSLRRLPTPCPSTMVAPDGFTRFM